MRSKQPVRRLTKKELDELFGIEEWTRHHVMMDDPVEGEPATGERFKNEAEDKEIKRAYEVINRKILVVELGNEVEYTTNIANLHHAKERRKKKASSHYINEYLHSIGKVK